MTTGRINQVASFGDAGWADTARDSELRGRDEGPTHSRAIVHDERINAYFGRDMGHGTPPTSLAFRIHKLSDGLRPDDNVLASPRRKRVSMKAGRGTPLSSPPNVPQGTVGRSFANFAHSSSFPLGMQHGKPTPPTRRLRTRGENEGV